MANVFHRLCAVFLVGNDTLTYSTVVSTAATSANNSVSFEAATEEMIKIHISMRNRITPVRKISPDQSRLKFGFIFRSNLIYQSSHLHAVSQLQEINQVRFEEARHSSERAQTRKKPNPSTSILQSQHIHCYRKLSITAFCPTNISSSCRRCSIIDYRANNTNRLDLFCELWRHCVLAKRHASMCRMSEETRHESSFIDRIS